MIEEIEMDILSDDALEGLAGRVGNCVQTGEGSSNYCGVSW